MSEPGSLSLEARLVCRIHQSLTVDVAMELGCEAGIVFGPSGAGKTTLLRLISGLARPDAGRVCLGGKTLFDSANHIDEPLRNRRIGMIFQDDRLFPHLSVAANIGFGLKGSKRGTARARLAEVAALCGVEHLLDRMPVNLSGGERQRVGLARALAPYPRLLLCDEPVSALDLANRHALLERLRQVQQALAIPMLYVTHSPSEAIALGSRLFLLQAGRLVADGSPARGLLEERIPTGGIRCLVRSAQRIPGPDRSPRRGAGRQPACARRRPQLDGPVSEEPPGNARCWSRSRPTTSCFRASRSPA